MSSENLEYDEHPHKPTPIVVEESNYQLLLEESSGTRERQAAVDPEDRPLYDLLMQVLYETDAHCPDLMPAALADHCEDLVHVRNTVQNIDRGGVLLPGYAKYGMSYCHNVRDAITEWRDRDPIRLVAVGCSSSKHDVDEPVPARELYRRSYWSVKRDYAETISDDWRIISAKHDLLHPDTEIPYYERSVSDLEGVPVQSDDRLPTGRYVQTALDQWAVDVFEGLATWVIQDGYHGSVDPRDVELEILLGRSYRDPLEKRGVFGRLRNAAALEITFPFQEIEQAQGGNGNQMGWMTDEVEATTTAATAGGAVADD